MQVQVTCFQLHPCTQGWSAAMPVAHLSLSSRAATVTQESAEVVNITMSGLLAGACFNIS